jgi:hypothetical protein
MLRQGVPLDREPGGIRSAFSFGLGIGFTLKNRCKISILQAAKGKILLCYRPLNGKKDQKMKKGLGVKIRLRVAVKGNKALREQNNAYFV